MTKLFTAFLLLVSLAGYGQNKPSSDVDAIRSDHVEPLPASAARKQLLADLVVATGKSFLGKPYVHNTLDGDQTEQLVVNLEQFDCTTFLETTLALALADYKTPGLSPEQLAPLFRRYLTRFRYRNGRIDGYGSRLHYFSDWLYDNERKGLIHDITREIGGVQVSKAVSYMTTATHKYPHLRDPAVYRQVAMTEAAISHQPFYFIPKKQIADIEANLRDGDIVMLTAARPGLDMKHVGFAIWQNGRVHLLHASSEHGQVIITPYPLADYVNWHKWLSGIRVARLTP